VSAAASAPCRVRSKAWTEADPARRKAIFAKFTACGRQIAELARTVGSRPAPRPRAGAVLHGGDDGRDGGSSLTAWRESDPAVAREHLLRRVGVNYDCCHLAVEFESPGPPSTAWPPPACA
jgi:hypothetical protein